MIQGIHQTFPGIGMGNVIFRFVKCPNIVRRRDTLGHAQSAISANFHPKFLMGYEVVLTFEVGGQIFVCTNRALGMGNVIHGDKNTGLI